MICMLRFHLCHFKELFLCDQFKEKHEVTHIGIKQNKVFYCAVVKSKCSQQDGSCSVPSSPWILKLYTTCSVISI